MKKNFTHTLLRFLFVCLAIAIFHTTFSQNQNVLQAVKQYALQYKQKLGISEKDVDGLSVTYNYTDKTTGIHHIYATQKINGLTVTASNFSLHNQGRFQTEANRLIASAKYKISPVTTAVNAMQAVTTVMNAIGYTAAGTIELKQAAMGSDQYTIFKRNSSSVWDIPCRLVYYNNQRLKTLTPTWEVQMMDAYKKHYWLAYVDAASGKIIDKKDLVLHCDFGGGVTDANDEHIPSISIEENKAAAGGKPLNDFSEQSVQTLPSNQYRVYNIPYESPIDPGATHQLVIKGGDILASPDGWHKVANAFTYNYTHGNNVWAFQDPSPGPIGGIPSADPTRTAYPTNTIGGTYPLVEPFVFDYSINLNQQPETYMKAAIVNLFFWNNLMHDVFYYMGFNEVSGNFQESNIFSTGLRGDTSSLAADEVLAQAQDGGGTNNANFLTLPDGTNGQMQMYLWTASFPDSIVQITSSSTGTPAAGSKFLAVQGSFSTLPTDTTNVYTNPVKNKPIAIVQKNPLSTVGTSSEGCSTGQQSIALPAQNVNGKIALIDRGDCSFAEKILGAQEGGAVGAIIINNVDGPPLAMGGTDAPANAIMIPAVMISKVDGDFLKAQINAGATIVGSLKRNNPPAPKRDGDIDNGVISHEYGHGISNRLTGGPNSLLPLGGDEQGGEGWSDFVALYMTLRNNDLQSATSAHPHGVLPTRSIGNYVTYQAYDGRGIREYPYSTNMDINPATFAYIKRPDYSETHSVGFVWCSMLYELLQTFIDEYGMNDNVYEGANPTTDHNPPSTAKGNNIAVRLVIEAMKLQPVNPTFIEERDAILKADTLLYNGQHSCAIWKAFAKRGLGYSAVSGTNGLGDEVEAFDVPFSCDPSQKRIRIIKTGPGIISNNTLANYTITITNLFSKKIKQVIVNDTLAPAFTFKSASDKPTVNGQIVSWTLTLKPNETKVLKLKAKLKSSSVSIIVFGDDQESGSSRFTHDASATANWTYETDSAQAYSGAHYWYVEDYDIGGSNTSLKTVNSVSIGAGAELVFMHKYAAESGYDGGVVEVSEDGSAWNYLPPEKFSRNGYSGIIPTANNPYIGLSDESAFTGVSAGYIISVASLEDYVGKNIYIRFRMTSDVTGGSIENGGWWIDNVYIMQNRTEVTNLAAGITTPGAPVTLIEGSNAYSTTSAFVIGASQNLNSATLIATAGEQNVDLNWQSSFDLTNPVFVIERKAANETDFTQIGNFSKQGYFEKGFKFTYKDLQATKADAQYRVNVINSNKSTSVYTNVAAAQLSNRLLVKLTPNPVKDVANISINNPSAKALTLNVYNISGRKLATFNAGTSAIQNISLPMRQLAAGTYWLEARTDTESRTIKMIVQK